MTEETFARADEALRCLWDNFTDDCGDYATPADLLHAFAAYLSGRPAEDLNRVYPH